MIVKKSFRNRYLQMDMDVCDDRRLSVASLGLLTFLLSRKPDWKVNIKYLEKRFQPTWKETGIKTTKNLLENCIRELKECGYVVRSVLRASNGQTQGSRLIVYENPLKAPITAEISLEEYNSLKVNTSGARDFEFEEENVPGEQVTEQPLPPKSEDVPSSVISEPRLSPPLLVNTNNLLVNTDNISKVSIRAFVIQKWQEKFPEYIFTEKCLDGIDQAKFYFIELLKKRKKIAGEIYHTATDDEVKESFTALIEKLPDWVIEKKVNYWKYIGQNMAGIIESIKENHGQKNNRSGRENQNKGFTKNSRSRRRSSGGEADLAKIQQTLQKRRTELDDSSER
jgi:hypothetical protein